MKPFLWLFQFVCGCHHKRLSRVFTIKQRTYQVCFECGQEFDYSWGRIHSSSGTEISESTILPQEGTKTTELLAS